MSIWKSTLVTGCALGTLITVGAVSTATGGQDYHSNSMPEFHQQLRHNAESKAGHFKHPVYGYMFKHPVYGYKFKHPVYGYMAISTARQNLDDQSTAAMESEAGSISPR